MDTRSKAPAKLDACFNGKKRGEGMIRQINVETYAIMPPARPPLAFQENSAVASKTVKRTRPISVRYRQQYRL